MKGAGMCTPFASDDPCELSPEAQAVEISRARVAGRENSARADVGRALGMNATPTWQDVALAVARANLRAEPLTNASGEVIGVGYSRPVSPNQRTVGGLIYSSDPTAPGYGTPDTAATTAVILARAQTLTENNPMHRGKYSVGPLAVAIVQAIVELIAQGDR